MNAEKKILIDNLMQEEGYLHPSSPVLILQDENIEKWTWTYHRDETNVRRVVVNIAKDNDRDILFVYDLTRKVIL